MELNSDGTVKASSVLEIKRIFLKPRENQSIRYQLATVRRSRVKLGEIAVLEDREWIRVSPARFHGISWIEIVQDLLGEQSDR